MNDVVLAPKAKLRASAWIAAAIGRLAVGRMRVKRLEIDELTVGRLNVLGDD